MTITPPEITPEEIAAFADGQLEGEALQRVTDAIAANPGLAAEVERHRALRATLSAHFAPLLEEAPPARLSVLLAPQAPEAQAPETQSEVVNIADARSRRAARGTVPRWGWIGGPALAASLVLALFLPRADDAPQTYAGGELATALDTQLAASQASDAETRILLSFRREDGHYCRAFTSTGASGIACRDASGWALVRESGGNAPQGGEFRQAGASQAELLAQAQDMATGPALDGEGEATARAAGWIAD